MHPAIILINFDVYNMNNNYIIQLQSEISKMANSSKYILQVQVNLIAALTMLQDCTKQKINK